MRFLPDRELQQLPRPILLFLALQVVLSSLAVITLVYLGITQPHRFESPGWGYFYFWPLGRDPHFPDIICFIDRFKYLHTPGFFSTDPRLIGDEPFFEYPAAAAFLYYIPYLIPGWLTKIPNSAFAFLLFIAVSIALLAIVFGKALHRIGLTQRSVLLVLLPTVVLSYPFWFEFGSANVEFDIFLLLLAGTAAFCTRRPNLAACFFGAAAGMKIFPVIFVALFLSRKQYRQIVLAAAVALGLNLAGLRLISPSIRFAYRGIQKGLAANRQTYMLDIHRLETSFDHSLFGVVKRICAAFNVWTLRPRYLDLYLALIACTGLALYFLRIRKLPVLNQIICFYTIAILFPPTSHDYTLIHLYVPWGLLVLYALRTGTQANGVTTAFACFAIACSCEGELILNHMGFSAQVKCLALVVLLVTALRRPWTWPDLEANTDRPASWDRIPKRALALPSEPLTAS